MQASMSREGIETPELTSNELSNEAIELLYDIVRRAQSSPDRSSRALFNAYEEILGEQGIGPENDGVLYKLLLRMQGDKKDGESLVQRYQRALADIDIHVAIDEEGEGIEVTAGFVNAARGGQSAIGRSERRSSLDSFFDGSADKVAGSTDFAQDGPMRSRRGSRADAQIGEGNKWKMRRSRSDTEANDYHNQLPIRTRLNGHADRRSTSEQHQSGHRRTGSASSRGSLQIRREETFGAFGLGTYDADDSDQTGQSAEFDFSNVQIPGLNAPIPAEYHSPVQTFVPAPFRPSDTRLMDDAEVFEQQRLHSLARRCLQTWQSRIRERTESQKTMNRAAIAYNRKSLSKKAFGSFRTELQSKQGEKETDRFFGRLELRAEKARNLFLLTKSFTHWARYAGDEVQRTSVAKRHIIRTKCFKGWRDITVVNELKVQHFVLSNFLDKWRRRTVDIRERQEFAMQLYDEKLLRKYIKVWVFSYFDIGAPAWHAARLKRVTLEKWRDIAITLRERETWATDRRERGVVRRALQVWRQRTTTAQSFEPQADGYRRRALLEHALCALQKQAQLAPLLTQFRAKVDVRLVRSAFQTWQRNAQLSRNAAIVDQQRLLRNAWTAWNDRLRIKALEERINDRVLVEAMYRWTLASRVSLFQRVHDRSLKESVFMEWVTKTNERRNTSNGAERRFAQFKRTQLLCACIRKIESATTEKRAEQYAVTIQYEQKVKQRLFDKFLGKNEHLQQLNRWASDARFYVLATHTLRRWNEASQLAKRSRRRELYVQIRRTVKLNMVRRAFAVWRGKANELMEQKHRADHIARTRKLENSRTQITHWVDRTMTLRDQEAQAVQHYSSKLQARCFNTWAGRTAALQTLDTQAVALRHESSEFAAASALKKLGWRLWNIQRQEENALALHQRNYEKHIRAMIRFWCEQTIERVAQRPASPTPTSRPKVRNNLRNDEDQIKANREDEGDSATPFDDIGDETRRLEAWTAFDEGALGFSNLDLSLSLSPDQPPISAPSASILSSVRPPASRPKTHPQPRSALRAPPPAIPEDLAFDDPAAFWTSTPMPPTISKPGYLKTPSKRSVARSKRLELPASPEKRIIGLDRGLGVMSAPPAVRDDAGGAGHAGVTSFERRLREGGFGGSSGKRVRAVGGVEKGKGKGRVGFGNVSHVG